MSGKGKLGIRVVKTPQGKPWGVFFWEIGMALLKLCAYPGCRQPAPHGERYCDEHRAQGVLRDAEREKKAKAYREKRRLERKGNASDRGYGYRWRQLATRFRAQHPYCAKCLEEGRFVLGECVDHIKPHNGDPNLLYDLTNLQTLCWSCHSRKTVMEDGGFGNPKAHDVKLKIVD